jgi:Tfp pilus assembly protein PilO
MKFIDFKNINVRIKLGLSIILPVIVVVLLGYFVILPSAVKIINIKADIESKRAEIEEKYKDRKRLGSIAEHLEKIRAEIELLDQPFVNNSQNLEFITSLENVANDNNVEQSIDLMTEEADEREDYDRIPIRISTKGKFKDQMNYLLAIESLNEYLNIDYLKISSISKNMDRDSDKTEMIEDGKVQLLIRADTFWCDKIKNDSL